MKDNSRIELRRFSKIDISVLAEWSRKINCILKHVRTENITHTNILIKAVLVYVGKKIGLKAWGSKNKKESEPWWKRKIKSINKVRKDINILERDQRGEIKRKEKYEELKRKYNTKKKGIRTVIEELKQHLHAKTANLKRYEERVNQYKINIMFVQNQKRVYQHIGGIGNINNEKPNAAESKQFWSNIWDNEKEHERNTEWLRELRAEKDNMKQNDINTTTEMIKKQVKKIPNSEKPRTRWSSGLLAEKINSVT